MSRLSPAEMHDIALAEKTAAHAATIRAAVAAGEPPLALIADRWTSMLADDALSQLLAVMALDDPAMAGHEMRRHLSGLIADLAEVEAEKDVEAMERSHKVSADEARIERAVYDQNMALFGWGGMS